VWYAWGHDQ